MKMQILLNNAKLNGHPYYIFAIKYSNSKSIYEKDASLEYCLYKMGFSVCSSIIDKYKIILGVCDKFVYMDEKSRPFNEIIARSYSKAYNIPVIMGIGKEKPSIFTVNKELILPSNDFDLLIYKLTGITDTKSIVTKKYHKAYIGLGAEELRNLFYHQIKAFGIDVVPSFIVAYSIWNDKKFTWLEALKDKITNIKAKKYISHQEEDKAISLSI